VNFKTKLLFNCLPLFVCFSVQAQSVDSTKETLLPEIVIKAFEQNRRLKDVPAAVNYIGKQNLERFSSSSIVMAVNTTPGVRMEERSPGSYRFNIRGSSLRSPFGVRNVKVYYNDIPITDPGGNTYLNQLGYYNFNSIEIIKGPGSSLYGSGTGGVLLIESMSETEKPSIVADYTTGSYGLQNMYGSVTTGSEKSVNKIAFQHQKTNGYRDHSALKRDVFSWNGSFQFDKQHQLKTSFLYGDHFYQTPGALTLAEYTATPEMARPGTEQNNTSIRQRTFIAGASYQQRFNDSWQNNTVLYGMFTEQRNPALRNYGKTSEPHVGLRTSFNYAHDFGNLIFRLTTGAEWQEGFSSFGTHKNVAGNQGALDSLDEINNRQQLIFAQATADAGSWSFTAGGSWNYLRVRIQRFNPATTGVLERKFDNEIAPRFSIAKKVRIVTAYASISKGFSPPTAAELTPSGSAINLGLNPEKGLSYDAGLKGSLQNGLYVDINAFSYSLSNTIVTRKDAGGGDYYINAGKTKQYGVETYISYPFLQSKSFMKRSLLWLSHTWHNFHYKTFKQSDNDFSGKQMPSEAPHTISTGYDFRAGNGMLGNVSYYYSGKIPLNDANTAFVPAYHLLALKLGYEKQLRQLMRIKISAGVENLLDQKYSLGNDINGFGGRYYNAAARRNYFVSLMLQWNYKTRDNMN
jgi:iron complex outermembrane recepter protein